MAATVELHPAYVFTCDECGRDVFLRSVIVEGGYDAEEDVDIIWVVEPERVVCSWCEAEFEVEIPEGEENDELGS